jgi:hypothetical protein
MPLIFKEFKYITSEFKSLDLLEWNCTKFSGALIKVFNNVKQVGFFKMSPEDKTFKEKARVVVMPGCTSHFSLQLTRLF